MGRRNKFETNVRPFLSEIPKWYDSMTEGQIAKKLGVSVSAFENYKVQYPELKEALHSGKEILSDDLKDTLRKKAKGFYYTETKIVRFEDENGEQVGTARIEETRKYAVPDTGAIHLLLKNIDPNWRNDDQATIDLKKQKLELEAQKVESSNW